MENINNKGNIIDRKNKRKLQNEELQEQDNEEEKVEQFFALIRNTKEMHDRLRNSEGLKEEKEKEKEMEQEKKAAKVSAAWNPTFQPEDFTEGDINNINASKNFFSENQQVGSSSKSQENEEEKEKAEARKEANNELDLKLSL